MMKIIASTIRLAARHGNSRTAVPKNNVEFCPFKNCGRKVKEVKK